MDKKNALKGERVIATKLPTATVENLIRLGKFNDSIGLRYFTAIEDVVFSAGDIVWVDGIGEGIIVGFSSVTNNPDIFFYEEQKIISVVMQLLKKV